MFGKILWTAFLLTALSPLADAADKKKPDPIDKSRRIEGTLAAVDVTRNVVRVVTTTKDPGSGNKSEQDHTLGVATDVRVIIAGESKEKGKPAPAAVKLGDLKEGMRVSVVLSEDKKNVIELNAARKENNVTGGLVSADAAKKLIVLSIKSKTGTQADEQYTVADDAKVLFASHGKTGGKTGTLADLREKTGVTLKLSDDGKTVLEVRVAAPTVQGVVKEVDAAKPAIVVTTGAKSTATDTTYAVAKDITLHLDGKDAKLGDIKPGTRVHLLLSHEGILVGVRAGELKVMK